MKFGVENHPNSYQANNMVMADHFGDCGQNLKSARRATPVVEDITNNAIMVKKPATPNVVSSALNQSCEVNWASDLFDMDANAIDSLQSIMVHSGSHSRVANKVAVKHKYASKRGQNRCGKF